MGPASLTPALNLTVIFHPYEQRSSFSSAVHEIQNWMNRTQQEKSITAPVGTAHMQHAFHLPPPRHRKSAAAAISHLLMRTAYYYFYWHPSLFW